MKRQWLIIGGAILLIIIAPVAWYLGSPLFINNVVNEDFPLAQAVNTGSDSMSDSMDQMTVTAETMDDPKDEATSGLMDQMAADEDMMSDPMTEATSKSMDQMKVATSEAIAMELDDPTPTVEPTLEPTATPAQPIAIKSGMFHAVEHPGSGTATIYALPNGTRTLRFDNLNTDNGPDLYVYLSRAADAHDEQAILDAGFVSLGRLKGNQGNQNYAIPAELDLSEYNSVSIWCQQFTVNFTTAPLQ